MRTYSARENTMCSRPATFLDVQSCCYAVKMSLFFSFPLQYSPKHDQELHAWRMDGTETILTELINLKTRISLWMNSDCKQWLRTLRSGSACEKKPESMTPKSRFIQWQLGTKCFLTRVWTVGRFNFIFKLQDVDWRSDSITARCFC